MLAVLIYDRHSSLLLLTDKLHRRCSVGLHDLVEHQDSKQANS